MGSTYTLPGSRIYAGVISLKQQIHFVLNIIYNAVSSKWLSRVVDYGCNAEGKQA